MNHISTSAQEEYKLWIAKHRRRQEKLFRADVEKYCLSDAILREIARTDPAIIC